jgi:hypothetical protein
MSPCARRLPPLLALAFAVMTGSPATPEDAPAPTRPTIYKWVDTNGIAHYTADPDRIPDEVRGLAHELREPAEPGGAEAPALATEPPADADGWATRDASPPAVDTAPPEGAGAPDAGARPGAGPPDDRELAGRIAALEEEIARDEERIKAWVSDPAVDPVTLADDPEFRELAARLPRLQADLRSLQERKPGDREP